MVTKTEDSLVFSWEGRHILFSFHFYFGHFSWMFTFIFAIDFLSFAFILVVYLYVHDIHFKFTSVSCLHLLLLDNFPLFTKTLPWRDIFTSCDTIANAMKQRFLAMMNCSEPLLFLFDFMFHPDVLCLSAIILIFKICPGLIVTLSPLISSSPLRFFDSHKLSEEYIFYSSLYMI